MYAKIVSFGKAAWTLAAAVGLGAFLACSVFMLLLYVFGMADGFVQAAFR